MQGIPIFKFLVIPGVYPTSFSKIHNYRKGKGDCTRSSSFQAYHISSLIKFWVACHISKNCLIDWNSFLVALKKKLEAENLIERYIECLLTEQIFSNMDYLMEALVSDLLNMGYSMAYIVEYFKNQQGRFVETGDCEQIIRDLWILWISGPLPFSFSFSFSLFPLVGFNRQWSLEKSSLYKSRSRSQYRAVLAEIRRR